MKIRAVAISAMFLYVTGCAYLPSVKNKLSVRPVKYVPCWENMGPNTSCGSVTVPTHEAEGFVVVVGWKRYEEITEPRTGAKSSREEKESRFFDFAAQEVVNRGYCDAAHVPDGKRNIMGWEGSGDRGVYVTCTK